MGLLDSFVTSDQNSGDPEINGTWLLSGFANLVSTGWNTYNALNPPAPSTVVAAQTPVPGVASAAANAGSTPATAKSSPNWLLWGGIGAAVLLLIILITAADMFGTDLLSMFAGGGGGGGGGSGQYSASTSTSAKTGDTTVNPTAGSGVFQVGGSGNSGSAGGTGSSSAPNTLTWVALGGAALAIILVIVLIARK